MPAELYAWMALIIGAGAVLLGSYLWDAHKCRQRRMQREFLAVFRKDGGE